MKNSISQSALMLGIVLLLLGMSSCTGLKDSAITVMEPAKINFPKSIQSFVVVNRAAPERSGWNTVEGLFTGEMPGQDREAARVVVHNLAEGIDASPRFSAVPSRLELTTDPKRPMDWKQIEKLTKKYDVDAVVVLESLDSNTMSFNNGANGRETQSGLRLFLRVYDPIKKKIVDEYKFTERGRNFNNEWTFFDRMNSVNDRYALTRSLGYVAGSEYARQIAPSFVNRPRKLYKKASGNDDMKEAYRLAKKGKWAEAAEIWDGLAESDKEKLAARASFNMALASEQIGEIANAIEWVDYSDDLLNKKINEKYAEILITREAQQVRVDEQLARIVVAEGDEATEENNEID